MKMNRGQRFPKITVRHTKHGYEATVAIELKSILKGDLLTGQSVFSSGDDNLCSCMDPRILQGNREAFLQAISGWTDNVILELSMTAIPDLRCRAHGKIAIVISISVTDVSEADAKEEVIKKYLAFMPLLFSHFAEGEFAPVVDEKELENHASPFIPTHGLAVHRRTERIFLTEAFQQRIVGLQSQKDEREHYGYPIIHRFPWIPSLDDWSKLLDILIYQLDPVRIIVSLRQAKLGDRQRQALEDTVRTCELYLSVGKPYHMALKRQVAIIRDVSLKHLSALTENAFNIGVYIVAPHPLDSSMGNVLGHAIAGRPSLGCEHGLFQGGFALSEVNVNDVLDTRHCFEGEAFCLSEAASAFRLPSPPLGDHPGLPVRRSRTSLAMIPQINGDVNDGIEIFLNEHHQIVQPIMIDADDRMRHTFIIGQTGTGKSTLMESMIIKDIQAGRGLAVVDPHGDMVDFILGKIPPERIDDVILFDVLDRECPLGFNILEWSTLDERDLIIDEIYTTIDRLYDMKLTGGPIFESNLRGVLKLLMGDQKHADFTPTLLDFITCYLSQDFRRWLKDRVQDPTVHDFVRELERTGGEASLNNLAPYITSKFGRYTHDTTLIRILGQEKTSFDIDEIINRGKIFLVKLGKGRFGPKVSALLANMLVSRFKYAAMKRGNIPQRQRRDFFLYVDECHNLPSENFTELLAEARKYRMGLILATQYTAQLANGNPRNDFLSAIIGNVGTIIIFRLGQEDAKEMASALNPYFSSLDIIGCPNFHGFSKLQMGGDTVPPFSFRSQKDESPFSEEVAQKIIKMSRFIYGTDAHSVDAHIRERRTTWRKDESSM